MKTELLLGDEAVAQGAIDAGLGGAFSYPGTPATEIFEHIERVGERYPDISVLWSANEKVAYEEALGMSYAGGRALVSMKHVGLNVAADPFVNSALTGVGGGLVLAVADDPGMHSSQNEQDSRFYGDFAQIPVFEPADQQEAYDMTLAAFAYSEEVGLPVMIRLVTRLAHSRSNVALRPDRIQPVSAAERRLPDPSHWTLVPVNARRRYRHLLGLQPRLLEDSDHCAENVLTLAGSRGIIASGIAHNYVREVLRGDGDYSILKIGRFPIPVRLVQKLVGHCNDILVAEDGYPLIEKRLNGLLGVPGKAIRGKLTGDIPSSGELCPDTLAAALGISTPAHPETPDGLAQRPPQLCKGCPHAGSFRAIVEAASSYADPYLFSDIGCYTLGIMPPFRAVHSCVDMGASVSMACGAARAGHHPVLCTIGDSTFAHSGLTGILGAIKNDYDMTVFILDNAAVAMTGMQESMLVGDRLVRALVGLGVSEEHLVVLDPLPKNHAENVEAIRREIEHRGLSVVISRRACIHLRRKMKSEAGSGGEA